MNNDVISTRLYILPIKPEFEDMVMETLERISEYGVYNDILVHIKGNFRENCIGLQGTSNLENTVRRICFEANNPEDSTYYVVYPNREVEMIYVNSSGKITTNLGKWAHLKEGKLLELNWYKLGNDICVVK